MIDILIYPRRAEHFLIGIAVDEILRTRTADRLVSTIDTTQFQNFTNRTDTFSLLAGHLVNQTVSAFIAIPKTSADFLVAYAAATMANSPFGLWLLNEVLDMSSLETDLNAVESIKRAAAVFASTPAQRNALADLFQRKFYIASLPTASMTYPHLYPLLFDTIRSEGRIKDRFFEDQFLTGPDAPNRFFDLPTPAVVHPIFVEMFRFCERLKTIGWQPNFVVDIGASTGIWSGLMSDVFPNAQFVMCDPMFSRYKNVWVKSGMIKLEVAISDKPGIARFQVADDLYGSSLLLVEHVSEAIVVPVTTLDVIARENNLVGRGMIKVDVQFAEHLVIQGGLETIANNIDVMIIEVTLEKVDPSALTMLEFTNYLEKLGFRILDVVGSYRNPQTGECIQLDIAYVRRGLAGVLSPPS